MFKEIGELCTNPSPPVLRFAMPMQECSMAILEMMHEAYCMMREHNYRRKWQSIGHCDASEYQKDRAEGDFHHLFVSIHDESMKCCPPIRM